MKKYLAIIALALTLGSCATKKQILYFQDVENLDQTNIPTAFEPQVEPNDLLFISLSAPDEDVIIPFNRRTGLENNISNNNPELQGYLVNVQGAINFPVLGSVPVAGKTRSQIEADLTKKLSDYVKDVVVDVRIMNFKVTVLGEVNNPGVYTVRNERVTLPEALGLAGDLTEDGDRNNIRVIREDEGKRIVTTIDITKSDFFSSDFYFLKQNDVIYIEPSLRGVKKSGFIPDIPALLSLFTVILSTVIIITNQ